MRALRCRCRSRRRVFTRRLSHQNCAHTRCNTRVTGIKGHFGRQMSSQKKRVLSVDDRFTIFEIFGGAGKKGKKEERKTRWRNFWNGLKGTGERRAETRVEKWRREGKVVEEVGARGLRGDDFLERESRSNWTIVQSNGFLKLCFVQFCCTWEEGCCSRFEKVFSTLKADGERGERKIQST